MRQAARGRGHQSERVVWQAHQVALKPEQDSNALGFRLTTDAVEETARGGSWKADAPFAGASWKVDEWTQERTGHVSFRLAREVE